MWTRQIQYKPIASREQIWKTWTDVSKWNSWDDQVKSSKLNGPFERDQTGVLIPNGGPQSTFTLSEVTMHQSFTSTAKLPLAKMDFIHILEDQNGELCLTHKVEISGLLSFLFARVIGHKLIKELPKALKKLDTLAQKVEI